MFLGLLSTDRDSTSLVLAFPSPHPLHHPHPAKAGCNVRCKPEIYSDTRTAVKYSPRCDTPPHVPRLLSPGLPVCITHLSWYGTKKRAGHRLLAHLVTPRHWRGRQRPVSTSPCARAPVILSRTEVRLASVLIPGIHLVRHLPHAFLPFHDVSSALRGQTQLRIPPQQSMERNTMKGAVQA